MIKVMYGFTFMAGVVALTVLPVATANMSSTPSVEADYEAHEDFDVLTFTDRSEIEPPVFLKPRYSADLEETVNAYSI